MERIDNLEHFIVDNNQSFYNFAFIFVADDLQAWQIVVDSVSAVLHENKNLMQSFLDSEDMDDETGFISEYSKYIYRQIYMIGERRALQLRNMLPKAVVFYQLDIIKRSILYLKYNAKLEKDQIASILSITDSEVISLLNIARKELLEKLEEIPKSGISLNLEENN